MDITATVKAQGIMGKVYLDMLEKKTSDCWQEIQDQFKNMSYSNCTDESTWLSVASKMVTCEMEDLNEKSANCSENKTKKEIHSCTSRMSVKEFINFCQFVSMVQPLCIVQHVTVGKSLLSKVFGTITTVRTGYGNVTRAVTSYLSHKESEYHYLSKAFLRGLLAQFFFLSDIYDDFKAGQFLFLFIWGIFSSVMALLRKQRYKAILVPYFFCVAVELTTSVLYDTWLSFFFLVDDHVIAIFARFFAVSFQILNLDSPAALATLWGAMKVTAKILPRRNSGSPSQIFNRGNIIGRSSNGQFTKKKK